MSNTLFLIFYIVLLCPSLAAANVINVTNSAELVGAIKRAHLDNRVSKIFLKNGIYQLEQRLTINRDHLAIIGQSTSGVIIKGRGMRRTQGVEILLDISGSFISISGITLEQSSNHLIQVRAEKNADNFLLTNCVLKDAYEQLLKVSGKDGGAFSDNGLVENCIFSYSKGIGPQYYIGGIDAHRANNWVVRNNKFENIASPAKRVAEHAIHFWKNSSNNHVVNNIILNSDRGIGFGLGQSRNQGGIIESNHIIHTDKSHPYADAGITLESSPDTVVKNNKILLYHNYPNAIEYRFPSTVNTSIINNHVNKKIKRRDGASAEVSGNIKLK